jgi:hypothetical protein
MRFTSMMRFTPMMGVESLSIRGDETALSTRFTPRMGPDQGPGAARAQGTAAQPRSPLEARAMTPNVRRVVAGPPWGLMGPRQADRAHRHDGYRAGSAPCQPACVPRHNRGDLPHLRLAHHGRQPGRDLARLGLRASVTPPSVR